MSVQTTEPTPSPAPVPAEKKANGLLWMAGSYVFSVLAAFVVAGLALTPFLEVPLGWLDRSYERGNRVHELWVQHHGRETLLVRTPDALRFGQIYRAVQRAVEQQTDCR